MRDRTYSTIPSDDDEFRTTVERLAARADDVGRLRELIASVYPHAQVSIQDSLGSLSGQPMRVYIYRDGVVPRDDSLAYKPLLERIGRRGGALSLRRSGTLRTR